MDISNNKKIKYCAGIELGGTFIKVAIGKKVYNENGQLEKCEVLDNTKKIIENTTPKENYKQIVDILKSQQFDEFGVASFGPLCLDEQDEKYGWITTTPKEGWTNAKLISNLKKQMNLEMRIGFDTDVNAAAMAEYQLGGHKVKNSLVYITIGTGVGIGVICNGKCVHGMMHPEGGHMQIPIQETDIKNNFKGVCKFHGTCLEGLVTNVSIATRLNKTIEELKDVPNEDPIWDLIAHYLTVFCANISYVLSPEVIVLGGGIMNRTILYDKIRAELPSIFNGYQVLYNKKVEDFIRPPSLGDNVGLIGAMTI